MRIGFYLFIQLLHFAFHCLVCALLLALNNAFRPMFYKLDKKVKLATNKLRKGRNVDIIKLSRAFDKAFVKSKIDGMEREYLYQRLKVLEDIIATTGKPQGPKYAAGDEMDRLVRK